MIHHRIRVTISLALALAATTAPAAWASPSRLYAPVNVATRAPVTPVSCGDVCSGHGYGSVTVVAARTPATPVSCGDACSGRGYGPVDAAATVVRVVAPGTGFDWGNVGIGAGGVIVLMLIATGGVLATTNRRRSTHQRAAN